MEYLLALTLAIFLAGLVSVWRFHDGSDKGQFRQRSVIHALFLQTSTPAVLCLIAGLWAVVPYPVAVPEIGVNLLPLGAAALVFYLLIKGMPGWTRWFPHVSEEGKRNQGMLLGYAAPMLVVGLVHYLIVGPLYPSLLLAFSGFAPPLVYVLGSRKEANQDAPLFQLRGRVWTAEELGRLSMGCLVFPLPLL